jgi:predicted RNase H-like HicB family nuclease
VAIKIAPDDRAEEPDPKTRVLVLADRPGQRYNSRVEDYCINLFYSNEDRGYIASIPDLKSCLAIGETPEEALHKVQIAKQAWLEICRAKKKPVPKARFRPARYAPPASFL